MSRPEGFELALFRPLDAAQGKGIEEFTVLFNPVSLEHSVKNTLKEQGRGSKKKQHVTESTAELTMELIFDTTDTGEDVRSYTSKLEVLMNPLKPGSGKKKQVATVVVFEWGSYSFTGMIQSLKQKIDFFAANGVPLRSTVNLSMVRQDETFEGTEANFDRDAQLALDAIEQPVTPDQSPTDAAQAAGDPRGARSVASANGQDSLRFSAGGSLVVGGGISLGGPAAFASGGLGVGAGAGIGAGISAGAGIGIGASAGAGISAGAGFGAGASAGAVAGFGASAGASAGAGLGFGASAGASAGAGVGFGASAGASAGAGLGFGASAGASAGTAAGLSFGASASAGASFSAGGSASAGVTASAGAFSGLRASAAPARPVSLNTEALVTRSETFSVSTGSASTFQVGGKVNASASGGLTANVGAGANLNATLRFEGE